MKKNMMRFVSILMAAFMLTTMVGGTVTSAAASKSKQEGDRPVTFYLVRHGETLFNVEGLMQGWSDSPLTENGIRVAENLSRGLADVPFVAAYSSTSERAMDTANIILKGRDIPLTRDQRLKEMNFGEWEGLPTKEIAAKHPDLLTNSEVLKQVGGETTKEVVDRAKAALEQMAEQNNAKGGNVLVVSHGITIIDLALAIDPKSFDISEGGLPNSSVTTIEWKNGQFKVLKVGDQSYAKKGERKLTFYFVRHGETLFNKQGKMQGWSDSPLTAEGIEVAKDLGKGLEQIPFLAAYSSTSERAADTAEYVLAGQKDVPLYLDKGLREMNFGTWEGMLTSDVLKQNPNMNMFDTENFKSPVGGEDYKQLAERTKQAMDRIIAQNQGKNGNILIVSHGITIMNYLMTLDSSMTEMKPLPNSSVTIVEYENGKFNVVKVGDKSYAEIGKKALETK